MGKRQSIDGEEEEDGGVGSRRGWLVGRAAGRGARPGGGAGNRRGHVCVRGGGQKTEKMKVVVFGLGEDLGFTFFWAEILIGVGQIRPANAHQY